MQHLDRPGSYLRILFVDFSSAFNTIILDTLQNKLTQLSVPTSICQWLNSFLTDRQQLVRMGKYTSSTCTISTGAPRGCVISPLLFSLYINDCTSKDPSVKLLKFVDDTTLIGLIQDDDESAYRQLAVWCSLNNLELNMLKTVEMIVDFRRTPPPHDDVLIQSEQKGWQNPSGPLTTSTLSLWTVTVWSTLELWAPKRPETGTVSFPKQSISGTPGPGCIKHLKCNFPLGSPLSFPYT